MHGKTMREALQEARNYRDPTNEGGPGSGPQKGGKKFSDKQIKQAYGILNDPRYKQGNYSGASKAIDKLAPGLSNHPDVKNAMKRANEEIEESLTKIGDFEYALRVHMVNNLGLSADAAANKIKKYKHLINKSMGVVHTAGMLLRKEDLDEAAFSQTQIDALKQKYSGLRGSEKNGIQMDKLAKIMKRYPKDHLNQLAKLDIPMVSKVAKAMTEETFNENWQYEMEIEYGDSMDDDQETIVVFGNVRGATLESQADRKYEQLEKQMQKKYGRDAMIDGGTMKGKTNDRSRGGSNPLERKDI